MKARPCGSMFGSVLPSLNPGFCISVNRSVSGFLPLAMALNCGAYLLAGLYATTICVDAYWTYHFVNLLPRSVIGVPPTLMNTFGKIVLAAISLDSPSDGPTVPRYLYPVALANAGPNTCSLRYASDAAYATFAVPDGLAFGLVLEPPEPPEELQPAAASPTQASAITPARRVPIL